MMFLNNVCFLAWVRGQVLINGTTKEIGMAVVLAVTKSRGMKVAGAVDSYLVGEDIRKSKATSVVVDFTDPSTVYDIVKQNPECLLSYDELPLKSSRNTFALLTILNEVDMNMYATGKFTIAMVDEPSSNGSATVSKFRCFEWICSGARKG
ncbi:dihydrodipicolinate reductase-like protein CRR1, chloroplastic isoform X2 [Tanacetum coccineum]|uniref:Dihydrodipicolinate reductase-like protein CRR1, chloroplastic isoform X2 n=1 Tax=Tanacetum coccineum TaxID=301880 RepID=A0ABQ4YKS7_9ASTR